MVIDSYNNSNSNMRNENGCMNGSSSGSDSASLRTYKRRKRSGDSGSKFIDLENFSSTPAFVMASLDDKVNKDFVEAGFKKCSHEQACDSRINCHSQLNRSSDDCTNQYWKNMLESIYESVKPTEGESGGVHNSIREVLKNPYPGHAKMVKENVDHINGKSYFHGGMMLSEGPSGVEGLSVVTSNGLINEFGHSTVSRLLEHTLSKLFMSGMFVSLCKLLCENFPGLKIDKLMDFTLINSRMKDGTYEHTPVLLSTDIQQLWGRLNSIGKEMVSLSNNLSELSRALSRELGGSTDPDTSSGKKPEAPARDCKLQIKQEDPDVSMSCTCKQCGEKSDERDCLVCDSCEAMFHVSCIEPAVKEIPHKSWYCASCTSSGVGSPHEDCVVCDRLNANSGVHGGINTVPIDDEEESSDGIIETGPQVFKGSKCLPCKSCGNNLTDGEEFCICEHRFCQFKYYHIRCLSNKELKSYGPRWYCPSCLCRACLIDKDDDDIVMCDGCDHGYHIYCMNPPRSSIPRGKWFCPKCDAGIKAIRKVKKFYEDVERYKRNEGAGDPDDGSSKKARSDFVDAVGGSGGMDMLLTAARTLNGDDDSNLQAEKC